MSKLWYDDLQVFLQWDSLCISFISIYVLHVFIWHIYIYTSIGGASYLSNWRLQIKTQPTSRSDHLWAKVEAGFELPRKAAVMVVDAGFAQGQKDDGWDHKLQNHWLIIVSDIYLHPRNLTSTLKNWRLEDDPFLLQGLFSRGYVKFPGCRRRFQICFSFPTWTNAFRDYRGHSVSGNYETWYKHMAILRIYALQKAGFWRWGKKVTPGLVICLLLFS